MNTRPARPDNVVELVQPIGIVKGKDDPLVPAGEYQAIFLDHHVVALKIFKKITPRVILRFRVVEAGPHTGTILKRWYRCRERLDDKRFVVGRRSALLKMMVRVLGLSRRPEHLDPRALAHKILRVRVRTVIHDGDQCELPPALQYSVVDDVIGCETE